MLWDVAAVHCVSRCLVRCHLTTHTAVRYRLAMPRKPAPPPSKPPARLASAFSAAMPPPKQSQARAVRLVVALSEGERDTIATVAELRGEPLATTVRTLAVTGAEVILSENEK